MWRSVPQIEAAWTRTRTSPSPGSGTGMASRSAPRRADVFRRARIVPIGGSVPARVRYARSRNPPTAVGRQSANSRVRGAAEWPRREGGPVMKTRIIAIALAAVALLAACGRLSDDGAGDGDGNGNGSIVHPTGANDLVLRIATGGGFVPVGFNLPPLPGVSISGDGRM